MATCCYPRCVACYEVVRYCPRCEVSFAVCASHRYTNLQCPWPTLAGVPCLAHVPLDQHWRTPLTYLPMHVSPSMGEPPPGLHRADIERTSTTRSSEEQQVNTDGHDRKGYRPCIETQTAEV